MSPRVRGLAWVVIRWAELVRPRVIMLENVEEFETWGPLLAPDYEKPDPERQGQTFRGWVRKLEQRGYVVEHAVLKACDYGAPTIRKRLFLDRAVRWAADCLAGDYTCAIRWHDLRFTICTS